MEFVPAASPKSTNKYSPTWLIWGAILATALPWLAHFLSNALRSPFTIPLVSAWICFFIYYYLAPKTGLAATENRRKIAIAAVLVGLAITSIGAFLLIFKMAWLGVLVAVSGLALFRLGVVPWTRVVAILSLIWIAWPWPGAILERLDGRLHRLGIQTAVSVFDLLGVPVLSVGNTMEFRPQSLDSSLWMNGPDSLVGLLLFAAMSLVWMRRTLVPAVVTMVSVPFIAWVGAAAKILLWYWVLNSYAVDLSEGWPLVFLRLGVFAIQLLMILVVNWGVHLALLPVLADPNARANVTVHSLYNVVTLWPLQISMTAQRADQDYLGDSDEDEEDLPKVKKRLITRRMPDVALAKQAPDPWSQPKLLWSTLAMGGLAVVLSLVANFMPAAKPMSLPKLDEQAVAGLANSSLLEGLDLGAQFTNAEVQRVDDQNVITFNLAGNSGPVTFMARFPSRSYFGVWTTPQGMTLNGPVKSMLVEDVTIHEATFAGQMGASTMGWFAAMLPGGESLAEPGFMHRMKGRLANSLVGRFVGLTNEQVIYETALLVDSQSSFSERQKREYRTLMAKLSQRLAQSVRGIQP
jgi:hypothetical protein